MSEKTNFEKVVQFMRCMDQEVRQEADFPCETVKKLRKKLHREEHNELRDAMDEEKDLAHIAKEICDALYVFYGTAATYGIDIDECFDEVHRSNMSKLGPAMKPIKRADGKILKSEFYSPANLDPIVKNGLKK